MGSMFTCIQAVMAEWLRRLTRNQMGSSRVGSNPTHSGVIVLKKWVMSCFHTNLLAATITLDLENVCCNIKENIFA